MFAGACAGAGTGVVVAAVAVVVVVVVVGVVAQVVESMIFVVVVVVVVAAVGAVVVGIVVAVFVISNIVGFEVSSLVSLRSIMIGSSDVLDVCAMILIVVYNYCFFGINIWLRLVALKLNLFMINK